MEELLHDLLEAQKKISESQNKLESIDKRIVRIETNSEMTITRAQGILDSQIKLAESLKGFTNENREIISREVQKIVNNELKNNYKKIEIEYSTKQVIYFAASVFALSFISAFFIFRNSYKDNLNANERRIEILEEKINWISEKYPEVNKAYIKHKNNQ